ncbi:MAG TPA: DUF1772 domain-containing protein [Thermoanaerobaculia bacterium]|nr:DUF1772 domain-containing protein [Thermoanaerobaculia bacterium]
MFAIWLAFDPAELTGPAYIEEHQNAIRALNVTMPILGAICIVLTIAHGWLARSSPAAFYLLLAGAAFMIVAGLITRFANQPINARVITWTPSAPPPGWMEVRDAWWQWHVGRTFAGIAAFLCIVAASVNPNAFKARYLERE